MVRKEEELTLGSQRLRRDQEALREARVQLERLEARMSETQEQLEREMERRTSLEEEKERLEESLNQFREKRGGREGSGLQADDHTVSPTLLKTLHFPLCQTLGDRVFAHVYVCAANLPVLDPSALCFCAHL